MGVFDIKTEQKAKENKKYLTLLDQCKFWDNRVAQAVPQPNIGRFMEEWLRKAPAEGKQKKCIFIGYDGCRADALLSLFQSGCTYKKQGDLSGENGNAYYSGIGKLKREGGKLYFSYTGGLKQDGTQQFTSTAPGWMALLTGVWGNQNGVINNGDMKNMDYKTVLLKGAEEMQMRTVFAASWEPHFTENYTPELDYLKQHPEIPMEYVRVKNDEDLHAHMLHYITAGDPEEKDLIFGIYEATDANGHLAGFGNNYRYITGLRNMDEMGYQLIEAIQNRPNYDNEAWLILIGTDHGGHRLGHGGQQMESRTTWVASNVPMDPKYFATGYDGKRAVSQALSPYRVSAYYGK